VTTARALQETTEVELPAKSLLRIRGDSRGVTVVCRSGLCWLTQEADLRDYVLRKEENFRINRAGLVLVQALADAKIVLTGQKRDLNN
jgi:Protein of unknown function (DUF2917)